MTTTAAPSPGDEGPGRAETESHDSVLIEFTDAAMDFTPAPVSEAVLRHLPSWLREAAAARGLVPAKPAGGAPLAACLLEQARLLVQLRRYEEVAPQLAEAEQLYQQAGSPAGVADCYHVAAEVHRGLGEPDKALDLLRREEELRRRLAA